MRGARVIRLPERARPVPRRPVLEGRGYQPQFRQDEVNHCPGCWGSCWWVGRSNAECAACGVILPIADTPPRIRIGLPEAEPQREPWLIRFLDWWMARK